MRFLNVQEEMTFIFHFNINNQAKKINQIIKIDLKYFLEKKINKYSNWIEYISILKYEYNWIYRLYIKWIALYYFISWYLEFYNIISFKLEIHEISYWII